MIRFVDGVALPERIAGLAEVAGNLWWSWNTDARALFRAIDGPLWHLTRHNPVELLRRVDPGRLASLAGDPRFVVLYDRVREQYARAVAPDGETWFGGRAPEVAGRPVAYFCAEFGLHNSVPIYSGGLGVLAGDHCKAASDLGVPLVAVGLMYTRGYFDQRVTADGRQEDVPERFDRALTPLERVTGPDGAPYLALVSLFGREVRIGAWVLRAGRVPVYLLDTDIEGNDRADRELTHTLYAGGATLRLRQEWILGVGGVRVLHALRITPAAWHANEGHVAFMLLERLRMVLGEGAAFEDAVARLRGTSVFTTHTPVPAGHDVFPAADVSACAGAAWDGLPVGRERLLALGRHPEGTSDQFHMTALAVRLCGRVNGVSRRHGDLTRRMWRSLWPGHEPERVPVGHVTNGVHLATWMAHPMRETLDGILGPGWEARVEDAATWDALVAIDPRVLWDVHLRVKSALMDFIHDEARQRWRDHWRDADHLVGAGTFLNASVMTIGFARRFAAYKRADLVFRDPERLQRLLTDAQRPVQLVFAGKAHPADEHGKDVLRRVHAFARDPRFEGRIAFLEDYELHMAHRLVQGVDVWLNLPRVPLEACGTSGMKAGLNAVPQLGTPDGWWAEGATGLNGWTLPSVPDGGDPDAVDAEAMYRLLEDEVVPLFYDRDARGVPHGWVERMKHALATAAQRFTAGRMVRQYAEAYYVPAMRGEPLAAEAPAT